MLPLPEAPRRPAAAAAAAESRSIDLARSISLSQKGERKSFVIDAVLSLLLNIERDGTRRMDKNRVGTFKTCGKYLRWVFFVN